ncbi:Plasmid stabilization system protein [uncultured spirochete]|jgi:toxin ParE1/3/4|uniref:Plasmid stabilization system protein n=1 Tax=uncultured spirochete TaxID=156406 RepID=A0A3P3XLC2_9SPIR|nr:type II toxin-antitoxin system RelE/ParE family toxin [Rectinema subterraneum]SLM09717.1 Plasmid stabilization system protein [uncultured spirochete]SLM15407.1 Plasmid stabilization system protein [uncultured spirochete]
MSAKYTIVFSRYAEDDLSEIIKYYAEKNSQYALKLLDTLETRVQELRELPARGRIVPELAQQNILEYRELIEGNYRIIYVIQDSMVVIHAILDSRRNLEELLMQKLMRFYS